MSRPEFMTNADAVWIGMEESTNLMVVSGLLQFDDVVDFQRLRQIIENRLLIYNRFKQKVVQPGLPLAPLMWEADKQFDLSAHIRRVALPSPANETALQQMVGELISTPLDSTKPLWQLHLIENVGSGSAILARIHHAIADGLALVMVLLSMADFAPDAPARPAPDKDKKKGKSGIVGDLKKQLADTTTAVSKLSNKVMSEGIETLKNPSRAVEYAQKGSEGARAASRVLMQTADPKTLFKGKLGVSKKVAWSSALRLNDVKVIKNQLGGGVNEVMITAVAGGLRRYLIAKGETVDGLTIRAALPMNLRQQKEMGKLGNKFGVLFVPLPIGLARAEARLAAVSLSMTEMKNSDETIATFGIQKGIGLTPHDIQSELMKQFNAKATAVLSNIPGPPMSLYVAGSKIRHLMVWMPQIGRVSLGLTLLTYAGKVFVGVKTDSGVISDPEAIIQNIDAEFKTLLDLAQEAEEEISDAKGATTPMGGPVMQPEKVNPQDLIKIKGVGPALAKRLADAGYTTIEKIARSSNDQVAIAIGVGYAQASKIIDAAKSIL